MRGSLSSRPRPPSADPRSISPARPSNTIAWRRCSNRSRRRGFRPSSWSRFARSSGATSSSVLPTGLSPTELRKLANRLPSSARAFWKEPLAEVLKAIEKAPDAVRDRFAAWRKARVDPSRERRGAVRAGDVGICRGSRVRRPRAEERGDVLEGTRSGPRVSRRCGPQRCAATRPSSSKASNGRPPPAIRPTWSIVSSCSRGSSSSCRLRGTTTQPRPRRRSFIASSSDENDEPTDYAVRLPPEYHPLRNYPALVVLHSGQGPERGDRPVGRRSVAPRVHPDRAGIHAAGPAGIISIRPPSMPPSSCRSATPASDTPSIAIGCSSPASSPGATWPGTTAWPTRTRSPGSS